jgi:hypothetical protein
MQVLGIAEDAVSEMQYQIEREWEGAEREPISPATCAVGAVAFRSAPSAATSVWPAATGNAR